MRPACLAAGLLALLATGAGAQQAAMQIHDPLGAAIRDTLIAAPELLAPLTGAPPAPAALYADAIARDRALLSRLAPRLFDNERPGLGPADAPTRIALFTRADCPDCARAAEELRALATRLGFRAARFDIEADATLASALGLDMAPSYVLPDRILRGHMPALVLDRYLAE